MKVLVACEFSGMVREAFRGNGHDAWSNDLLPTEDGSRYHIIGNALEVLQEGWDLMIAHPPCTYLSVSGLHWNTRIPGRAEKTEDAIHFVEQLMAAPIERWAIENPIGILSTRIRKPDQIIHPWQFGHRESKATCLWLKNLPLLQPTEIIAPAAYQANGRPRWDNQTPTGQNKLGPSPDRGHLRSITYRGIAEAMGDQWG